VGKELGKMEEEDNMGRRSKFLQSRNLKKGSNVRVANTGLYFIFFFLFYLELR